MFKTVEFTEKKGLTDFMSTGRCRKKPDTTLHKGVEVCVEVVEALTSKGFTKNGMQGAAGNCQIPPVLKFSDFAKKIYVCSAQPLFV